MQNQSLGQGRKVVTLSVVGRKWVLQSDALDR